GYAKEAKLFGELAMTPVSQQLRNIFHATNELKKETFAADGVEPRSIQHVGVLDACLMGAGIALTTANKAHIPVRLKDRDDNSVYNSVKYLNTFFSNRVKRCALTRHQAEAEKNIVSFTADYSGFKELDIVVEAVFENLDLKHQMINVVEEHT